jgi:hypothetical protein
MAIPEAAPGKRRTFTDAQKRAVLKDYEAIGFNATTAKYRLAGSVLRRWATDPAPKAKGNGATPPIREPRGLTPSREAYIQLRRWYDARLKWIRAGGVPGTHDVYAELALRALEGNK